MPYTPAAACELKRKLGAVAIAVFLLAMPALAQEEHAAEGEHASRYAQIAPLATGGNGSAAMGRLRALLATWPGARVVEEIDQPYVRTAALKGLSARQVVGRHALRNALRPTITVVAISLGWLMWMRSDNSLEPIREHPRFVALMERGTRRLAEETAAP